MTARKSSPPTVDVRLFVVALAVALAVALNVYLMKLTDWTMLRGGAGADWTIFQEAGHRILGGGDVYAVEEDYAFRYSPIFAYAFAAVGWIGPLAWRLLHLAAAASLVRLDWRLALAVLVAWPFWFDVEAGNLVTFALVLAAFALAGRGWAVVGSFALALLVPRPLVIPVVAWLLWRKPQSRLPFAIMFGMHAVGVAITGWGLAWIAALAASTAEAESALNFGPSRLIGVAWIPIGALIAVLLTWRGRLGLAGLVASPYWLPYYFLMPLLDINGQPHPARPDTPLGDDEPT